MAASYTDNVRCVRYDVASKMLHCYRNRCQMETRKRIEDRTAPMVVATSVLAVVRALVLVPVPAGAVAVVPILVPVSVYMVVIPAAAPWSVVIPLLLLFAFCSRFNI